MKRIKILLLLFFFVTGFSVNAMSPGQGNNGNHFGQEKNGNNGNHFGQRNNGNNGHHGGGCPVGAPLDGGLLSVLGVAGVAYYTARKKGKKPES